jgi:hypothetical protein
VHEYTLSAGDELVDKYCEENWGKRSTSTGDIRAKKSGAHDENGIEQSSIVF